MSLAPRFGRYLGIARPPAVALSVVGEAPAGALSVSRTHVGRVRAVNEDRVLDRPDAGLWAVIDGMGGHQNGDVAAEAALRALATVADRGRPGIAAIEATLREVNRSLFDAGRIAAQVRGATIAVALRSDDGLALAWAGDCRVILLRDGEVTRLTRDHSLVQDLIDAGQLTEEQAQGHPRSNVVTRALGAAETIAIETRHVALRPGDTILLCSDGLDRPERSLAVADGHVTARDALADHLLEHALARGGRDNVSLILVDFD